AATRLFGMSLMPEQEVTAWARGGDRGGDSSTTPLGQVTRACMSLSLSLSHTHQQTNESRTHPHNHTHTHTHTYTHTQSIHIHTNTNSMLMYTSIMFTSINTHKSKLNA